MVPEARISSAPSIRESLTIRWLLLESAPVDLNVYDVSTKVTGLSVTADVLRLQADGGSLQGVRLFVVSNTSTPAKTQMNDHNFEFFLPPGAKLEQVQARAPNGQPIAAEAAPQAEKNRYAIAFPLRPGETQRAGKVGVKLVFPIFFFIMPSMMIVAAGPGMLQLFKHLFPMMKHIGG